MKSLAVMGRPVGPLNGAERRHPARGFHAHGEWGFSILNRRRHVWKFGGESHAPRFTVHAEISVAFWTKSAELAIALVLSWRPALWIDLSDRRQT